VDAADRPYADFAEASQAVLGYLARALPLGAWMVTRSHGDRWVVLRAEDQGYGVQSGDQVGADETLCEQVSTGRLPNIVPDTASVAALRGCGALARVPIGTYVSFPLTFADGALFGTLCGLDPTPGRADPDRHAELLRLLARQLSTILAQDLDRESAWRAKRAAEAAAERDALTGLLNRRGFDLVMARTEARCRDLGGRAGVIQIDLDGLKALNDRDGHAAGDALLVRAAQAIAACMAAGDACARTGGDEFTVIVDGGGDIADARVAAIGAALQAAAVSASIGSAERKPRRGLVEAWARADRAMYDDKRRRRAAHDPATGRP
jgi:diguanylate cyclase (GGDEF)-like protein